jgi:regulator of RNase E activity RraA
VTALPALPEAVRRKLETTPTAIITDAFLRLHLSGWMEGVHPVRPDSHMVGRARTLRFAPVRGADRPTQSIYGFIRTLAPGDVLVVGADVTCDNLMGDNIARAAQVQGLAGIVTDSRNRDNADIAKLAMPLFSRGAATRPPVNVELTDFDVPLTCADTQVRPGDIVLGDRDGVLVIPASQLDAVLYQAVDIEAVEHDLAAAVDAQAPLEAIGAILKRKKALRA